VSIEEFYALMDVIEKRGGKPKFRSVPVGEIPLDTFHKICSEAEFDERRAHTLFTGESVKGGEALRLKKPQTSRSELLCSLAEGIGGDPDRLGAVPAVDFFLQWIVEGRTPYELCCTSRSAFTPFGPGGEALTPELEAARLALAQLYVLTLGQAVPAIYFNDLLGLDNDFASFGLTGKPRDLNRRKNYLPRAGLGGTADSFTSIYVKLINRILEARVEDTAFYPGSPKFELRALTDTVFLNHPYARGRHSFVCGNIAPEARRVSLSLNDLEGVSVEEMRAAQRRGLVDALSGRAYQVDAHGGVELEMPPYGALWLQPV